MASQIEKYGRLWPVGTPPLKIEMSCIKNGFGKGLPFHYDRMREIIWPELYDHRWHRLIQPIILSQKCTVLAGCASSGKTHTAACLFLMEYWCFPDETCVLVSSTDMRGLKGRIWSEITMLWQKGYDRFPWLAGHQLDSRVAILTDDLGDDDEMRRARDYRKCIQGVPCREDGQWVGLNRYCGWKQKRMRLIADEACFPAGTLVDTPTGRVAIEKLNPGDLVIGALGPKAIKNTQKRFSKHLVKLSFANGRSIVCTRHHPFLTSHGWKVACHLDRSSYMVSSYEAMSIMRGAIPTIGQPKGLHVLHPEWNDVHPVWSDVPSKELVCRSTILRKVLCSEVEPISDGNPGEALHGRTGHEDLCRPDRVPQGSPRGDGSLQTADIEQSSHVQSCVEAKDDREPSENRAPSTTERREWYRTNKGREGTSQTVARISEQFYGENREETRERVSSALQGGRGNAEFETGGGGGWEFTQEQKESRARLEKDGFASGAWLDGLEVLKLEDFEGDGISVDGVGVYNLEVEGHPSFSVNGLLVHNSQMANEFINGVTNLNSNPDFKCVIIGNFSEPTDCLGRCAEPVDGWSAHMSPMKTDVWDTFYPLPGKCVNLIGFDSPNFDFPKVSKDEPDHYRELIGPKRIAEIEKAFGRESWQFYSQCWGAMKVSQLSNRVLTRELCEKGHAFEEAVWEGSPRTNIGGLDSAWGGDRCVFTFVEFGKAVGGGTVIQCHPPETVPTVPAPGEDVDHSIARWVRQRCEQLNIPPENFFHDSTGRGSLGTALAQEWSAQCNPVEFGGPASKRPVPSFHWMDLKTTERRLKTWAEHGTKFVVELWFSVRYCVESGQLRGLSEEVLVEFVTRIHSMKGDKIDLEPKSGTTEKPGMKQRTGKSPDLADSLAIAIEGARRRGFVIDRLENKESKSKQDTWLHDEAKKYRDALMKSELVEV